MPTLYATYSIRSFYTSTGIEKGGVAHKFREALWHSKAALVAESESADQAMAG